MTDITVPDRSASTSPSANGPENASAPAVGPLPAETPDEDGTAVVRRADEAQFITFAVGSEEYGIGILAVREIRGWSPVSRLPNMPHYVCGVMNLRGIVIPIYDLRARFGGGATAATARHVVIVVRTGHQVRGILADAISDILTLRADQVQRPPSIHDGIVDAEYVTGIYAAEGRMVALLSVDCLFDKSAHHAPDLPAIVGPDDVSPQSAEM